MNCIGKRSQIDTGLHGRICTVKPIWKAHFTHQPKKHMDIRLIMHLAMLCICIYVLEKVNIGTNNFSNMLL